MHVLWVSAHPDPRSLTASLRTEGLTTLRREGHAVRESDLYAMGWDPVVSSADFGHDPAHRLDVLAESDRALAQGTLSADIRAEHDKLRWADTLVVQFPLWWFSTPAILKGWFDRVFLHGFAYGVRDPDTGRTLRYGDGGLVGRRALAVVTVGAQAPATGPRGIHGHLEDVLFPLLHGTFWYTGMSVLPPVVVNGTVRLDDAGYAMAASELRERLRSLGTTTPIPYRSQDGGDYDEHLVLHADVAPAQHGLDVHRAADDVAAPAEGKGFEPLSAGSPH